MTSTVGLGRRSESRDPRRAVRIYPKSPTGHSERSPGEISGRNTGGNSEPKYGEKSVGKTTNNPANNPGSNPGNNPEFLNATLSFFRVYNRRVLPASLLTRAVAGFPEDFHEGSF